MKIKIFLFSYYKSLIVFLLILFASTLPASEVPDADWISIPNFDKFVHFGMYFTFTAVLIYDVLKSKPEIALFKILSFSATLAMIYGGIIEIIQWSLTNSRSGDVFDFLSNSAGILVSVIIWVLIKGIPSK